MEYEINDYVRMDRYKEDKLIASVILLNLAYGSKSICRNIKIRGMRNIEEDLEESNKNIAKIRPDFVNCADKLISQYMDKLSYFEAKKDYVKRRNNELSEKDISSKDKEWIMSDREKAKKELMGLDSDLENICYKLENVFVFIKPNELGIQKKDMKIINKYIADSRDYKKTDARRNFYRNL